jgi:hypothetical protein
VVDTGDRCGPVEAFGFAASTELISKAGTNMTPKGWFLGVATVGHGAAARFAQVQVDEFRDAAESLGFGTRLTYAQVVEVIDSLSDEDTDEDDIDDEDEAEAESDDDSDDEES